MGNSKYGSVLTIVLIISILAIIGLLIYVGVDWYIAYTKETNAENVVDQFHDIVNNVPTNQEPVNIEPSGNVAGPNTTIENTTNQVGNTSGGSSGNTGSSSNNKLKLGGYDVIGTIEIPKTKIEYPILDAYTPKALELAICRQYGPGLNQVGNTVLIGHNFRNGTFFSNNSKLSKRR